MLALAIIHCESLEMHSINSYSMLWQSAPTQACQPPGVPQWGSGLGATRLCMAHQVLLMVGDGGKTLRCRRSGIPHTLTWYEKRDTPIETFGSVHGVLCFRCVLC